MPCSPATGEEAPDSIRAFRIGFLRSDESQALELSWYEHVKRFLLEQPSVMGVLEKNHYNGIAVLPAEGYRDMLQRMDLNEFDLAFCSGVIFVEQKGDYRPILQLRGDIFDSRGQGKTLQKGVIITGRKSPFFSEKSPEPEKIGAYISTHPMAFVSVHSAVGYVYPRLSLWRRFKTIQPGDFIFCGSSEEVVKYVVSGIVNIGACEREAFYNILEKSVPGIPGERLARILIETPPAPTNPIVIRSSLHPQKSEIGRALKAAIKIYYTNSRVPGIPRIADARDENFKNLREEIEDFHLLLGKQGNKKHQPQTESEKSPDGKNLSIQSESKNDND